MLEMSEFDTLNCVSFPLWAINKADLREKDSLAIYQVCCIPLKNRDMQKQVWIRIFHISMELVSFKLSS